MWDFPPPSLPINDATIITVDNGVTYQRVDGFGGTTLPLVYPTGDYLGRYRQAAIRSTFESVGISLGRRSRCPSLCRRDRFPFVSLWFCLREHAANSRDIGQGAPDTVARQQLEQLKSLGQRYNVPIWITELTEGPGTADYPFEAIENVLARAINIHDDFEYAGASAYFGMNTIWDSRSHEEHFAGRNVPFLTEQSGMVLVDRNTGDIKITGMGYAEAPRAQESAVKHLSKVPGGRSYRRSPQLQPATSSTAQPPGAW